MASTNKTTNYELSQFQSSDIPAWLTDYNGDMQKIDAGIHAAKVQADGAALGVSALQTAVSGKQDKLVFDSTPLSGSANPVTSDGIYNALQNAQVQTDATPTAGSSKPVQSGGVYTALQSKQNNLTFDNKPTADSVNPVTSGGVFNSFSGFNKYGTFKRYTPNGVVNDEGLRYYYNPISKLFIAYHDLHQLSILPALWEHFSVIYLHKAFEISGNPFELTVNTNYPTTDSEAATIKRVSLGSELVATGFSVEVLMAYFADVDKTMIVYRTTGADASTHTIRTALYGDTGYVVN